MLNGLVLPESPGRIATRRALAVPPWAPGWLLATIILCAVFGPAAVRLDFAEPDNAMRLVQVRDLLAGQAWFDLTQSRMGLDGGVNMHWARWIDAAIAVPISALAPLLGQGNAEIVVGFVWPLGLLLAFMTLIAAICRELAPEDARGAAGVVGPILAALAFPVMDRFAPGAFDHHNVILVLLALALFSLLRMGAAPKRALVAGLALAAAMGAAAEALPFVAAGVAGAGLAWLADPRRFGGGLLWLGAGLVAGGAVAFLIQVPPSRWGLQVCDSMSPAYLGFAGFAGLGAMALGALPQRWTSQGLAVRAGFAGAVGALGLVAIWILFPECRGGGYGAVSSDMKTLWMAQIAEARSIVKLAADDIGLLFGLCGAAAFGLVAMAYALRRDVRRAELWIVAGFVIVAWAVMIWQVRGASLATAFTIPFATLLVVRLRQGYRAAPSSRGLLAFVLAGALSMSAVWSGIGEQVRRMAASSDAVADFRAATVDSRACTSADAYQGLAALPPARMLNPFSLGPAMLLHSGHHVVAGPYHRNEAGTMSAINLFRSDAEAARASVEALGVRFVVVCPASPESSFYAQHAVAGVRPADTLADGLARGAPPSWLREVDAGSGPLRLYEVVSAGAG